MNLKEMREKRAKLVTDAQDILQKYRGLEKVPETQSAAYKEDMVRFEALMDDQRELKERVEAEERAAAAASELGEVIPRKSGKEDRADGDPLAGGEHEKRYTKAFRNWLRGGASELDPEDRVVLRAGYRSRKDLGMEERAQTVTTTGGGYLIPDEWMNSIEVAMTSYAGVLAAPTTKWDTDTGALIPYPTIDDTSNSGALLGINTQESEGALTFGVENFNAYKFTSKHVLVPIELIQDAAFNVDALIKARFAERLGRVVNTYGTTGTGTSQPEGIVTGSFAGATAAASNAVAYNDLNTLKYAVDPAYRSVQSCGWMLKDSTVGLIERLVDSQNRPLWLPGMREGRPDTIMGHPYWVNQAMASVEASAKSVLFGDLSKYIIRQVREMVVMRLVERYADYYQVGFQAFIRLDSRLVDAGTHPIKHLVHPSP